METGPVVVLVAVGAAAAAYFTLSNAQPTPPSVTPTAVVTSTSRATATPTPIAAFQGSRSPVQKPGAAPPLQLLTNVQAGKHEDYDRLVFTFRDAVPGYRVAYVQPPIVQDGSGLPVEVRGSAFLQVRMEPASGYDMAANRPAYTGPKELTAGFTALLEAQQTGDFEAVLSWVIGVPAQRDFRVLELSNPPRLVVDIGHKP